MSILKQTSVKEKNIYNNARHKKVSKTKEIKENKNSAENGAIPQELQKNLYILQSHKKLLVACQNEWIIQKHLEMAKLYIFTGVKLPACLPGSLFVSVPRYECISANSTSAYFIYVQIKLPSLERCGVKFPFQDDDAQFLLSFSYGGLLQGLTDFPSTGPTPSELTP